MNFKTILNYLILFISVHLFMFTEWLHRYFGKVDLEQILIFFNFGLNGLLNTEEYVIEKYFQLCIYFPLFIIVFVFLVSKFIKKIKIKTVIYLNKKITLMNLLIFIISFLLLFQNLEVTKKINNLEYSNFIEENYIPPKFLRIDNKKKKDLLVIYLESFNENFTEKKISKKTKEFLNFVNFENHKVNQFYETVYNNYTIGSIVSSQCGLPQKPIGILDTRFRERKGSHIVDVFGLKNFLPKAICLGDILDFNGYKNIFINSINPSFQAMDIFFKDHKYNTLIGKKYLLDKGYKDFNSWGDGANDRVLFEETIKIIKELKMQKEHFNITLLTTDSHYPGYFDDKCANKDNSNKKNLTFTINCTAKHLYKFIETIKKKYGESIVIVVVGDHLMPKINNIDTSSKEFIYNRFINTNIKILRDKMNHYDLYSTILDLINYPYTNKVGLGYSVLREHPDLNYESYKELMIEEIEKKSNFYYEFWK